MEPVEPDSPHWEDEDGDGECDIYAEPLNQQQLHQHEQQHQQQADEQQEQAEEDEDDDEAVLQMAGPASYTTINTDVLRLWTRRCRRKFRHGVMVIRCTSQGKLVKRNMFVGAKPEYFELTSKKLYDVAYHLSEIESMAFGLDSEEFSVYQAMEPERLPKPEKCLVIQTAEKAISLIFRTASDRRDCQFLLKLERSACSYRYNYIAAKFEQKKKEAGLLSP